MLFNSLQFLVFFPIVVVLYFTCAHRFRWLLILSSSYYFYMCWKAEYVVLIIVSTLIDYIAGIQIARSGTRHVKKLWLWASILTNLGILFSFKYFNFFNDSFRGVLNHFNVFYDMPAFQVLLPVGISFYTFQSMSYTIDIYKGLREPERHLGIFASYVAFFPQLVAGPIERSRHLIPQFYKKHSIDYNRIASGLKLMAWGFFKKLVIADRLAIYVNKVYNNPTEYQGVPVIAATYFFAYQIYCDFSGYSDIAVGSAKVMGYDIMDNFKRPYYSRSISEFWRRWHISLSSWFRDYVYIPLGGNRGSELMWLRNIMIVFVVSGLWHGAKWTFVLWGAIHGIYLVVSIWSKSLRERVVHALGFHHRPILLKWIKIFITFHLVVFTWVFFRANSVSDSFILIQNMFKIDYSQLNLNVALGKDGLVIAFLSLVVLEIVHLLQRNLHLRTAVRQFPLLARWGLYYGLVMSILVFGIYGRQEFIYFRF